MTQKVRKFRLDIELLGIGIFTLLLVTQSISLLSPVIDFIASVFEFSFFTVMIDQAWTQQPEEFKIIVIFIIFSIFVLILFLGRRRTDYNI